jgi:hypothetical protein
MQDIKERNERPVSEASAEREAERTRKYVSIASPSTTKLAGRAVAPLRDAQWLR